MIRSLLILCMLFACSLSSQAGVNISVFADHIYEVARQEHVSFREAAQQVYDAGVRGVDVYVTMKPEDLQVLDEIGFSHATTILVSDFVKNDCTADIEKSISFAREHHYDRIMLVPGFMPQDATPEQYKVLYKRIEQLVKRAGKVDITVTVEDYDHAQSPCYNTQCLDRMFRKCPSLGLTFDTGNFCFCNEDVMTACKHFIKKIKHVHLKDRVAMGQKEVVSVGTGIVPLRDFITTLAGKGYDGWFTVEFYGSKHMLDDIRTSVENIRSIAAVAADQFDYPALNQQAAQEYLVPIRPGYEGRNAYWNVFALKFIYAPAFDFQPVDRAVAYRFQLKQNNSIVASFQANSPNANLSPVWNELPVGDTDLTVVGLDKDGKELGQAGTRSFYRDYPFQGPYSGRARSYREAAIKGMLFVHNIPQIHYWLTHTEPDMSFENNTYACKIIGATVRLECLLAKEYPAVREEALQMARNAAECLIAHSFPEGTPLAYFPPTYYLEPEAKDGWPHHVYEINQGKTMFLEAVMPANAFLDLYDLTKDKKYLTQTLHIMDTYQRMQNPDGSFPIKARIADGQIEDKTVCSVPTPLLALISRLDKDYGINTYNAIVPKAEKWVNDNPLKTFDIPGQYEDQTVEDLPPFKDLNASTACEYAEYLLTKDNPTQQEIQDATDLIRMSEDQFVHWDMTPTNGLATEATPCVHEQYAYEVPVDASNRLVGIAFYDLYKQTGDKLALAKALALFDAITQVQNVTNGQIPTTWEYNPGQWDFYRTFWPNCTYLCVQDLLRVGKELGI